MVRLKDICDVDWGDTNLTKQAYVENGKYLGVSAGGCDGRMDYYDFEAYTPVISAIGANCGKMFLPKEPFVAIKNTITLKPHKDILGKYIFYALNSNKIPHRGGGQPFISKTDTEEYMIICPSLEEQTRIVTIFDKICKIIDMRHNQLSKLDELVKSRFIEMFGGIGYPEDTLLNLCNIIDYRGKTPEKVEQGLPFITAKNVKMHQMNLEPREYISKETYDKVMVRGFPKEGDVVFTTEAPLGNVCRIPHFDTEFYIGQRIVTMQTEKLEPIYLEYALCSDDFKAKYTEKSSGSTVTGIRVRLLEQLTIPVPPIELQNEFATFVEQTDKLKLEVEKSLEKLETLKKSLMQQYFG